MLLPRPSAIAGVPFAAGPARPASGHEAHQHAGAVEGAFGVGRAIGPEVPAREAIRQLHQPRALARRQRPFNDLGQGLDEYPRVLGVRVVGHMQRDARVVTDVTDPARALAPDHEESPRVEIPLVPHRRDIRPPVARDRGDAPIPRMDDEREQLPFGETANLRGWPETGPWPRT